MMTGASRRHDQIVFNIHRELGNQLRAGPCRGFTSDTAVRTAKGRRRPDAGVECGQLDDQSYEAGEVRMVVEVLSPSTRDLDTFGKLDEYKAIDSMDHVLLVEPNAPQAILWSRTNERAWAYTKIEGVKRSIEIGSLGLVLKLEDIYAGLTFRPVPKIVEGGES
jgi:Uma2 family endonuclease